jgi:hypothetical protein
MQQQAAIVCFGTSVNDVYVRRMMGLFDGRFDFKGQRHYMIIKEHRKRLYPHVCAAIILRPRPEWDRLRGPLQLTAVFGTNLYVL